MGTKLNSRVLATGILCLAFAASGATSDPLDTWYWRNPTPQGNPLYGVCYGNNEFVAVGANGTVMTSPDGEAWLNHDAATSFDLHGIVYGGGRYVTVGDYGVILYSDDARTWQPANSPWFYHLKAVTWGNGLFVAVGENTAILTSPDGETWTLQTTGSVPLNSIVSANGVFIAGGDRESSGTQMLLRSTDGTHWVGVTPGFEGPITALGFGFGKFIASVWNYPDDLLLTSADGLTWHLVFAISLYANGQVISIVDDGTVMRAVLGSIQDASTSPLISTNGIDWNQESNTHLAPLHAMATGGGRTVAVGESVRYGTYGLGGIVIHTDARGWTPVAHNTVQVYDMVAGNSLAVGIYPYWNKITSANDLYATVSSNGFDWQDSIVVSNRVPAFNSFTFGNGLFLMWDTDGFLAHSKDGSTWTTTTNLVDPYQSFQTLVPGDGAYVWLARGSNYFLSSDLTNWEALPKPADDLPYPPYLPAAYGNGYFVLTDTGRGGVQRSVDGRNWEFQSVPNLPSLFGFFDDRFLGWKDGLCVSTNGVNWFRILDGSKVSSFINATYGDGRFLISGVGYTQSSPGFLLASADEGATWTAHQLPGTQPFWRSTTAFDSVILNGGYGALVQSAPLHDTAPTVVRSLNSRALQPGEPLGLAGDAYGSLPMNYEWIRDGVAIPGADEPLLPILNTAEGESHEYSLVISNAFGSVTNGPVRVTAGSPASLALSSDFPLNGSLSGTAGLTYRIDFQDGSPAGINWQTLTNLTLTGNSGTFNDSPMTNRFYRARLMP